MDVEAQEEGVLAKILVPDGTHNVNVGKTIAVLAEQGDDISTLELPAEDAEAASPPTPPSKDESDSKPADEAQNQGSSEHNASLHFTDTYSPAVLRLLQQYGIKDPKPIPTTGPQGRLLKGDVLAHVGSINRDVPKTLHEILARKQTLDLSNIQVQHREVSSPPVSQSLDPTKSPTPPSISTVVDLATLCYAKAEIYRPIPYSVSLTIRSIRVE